MPTSSRAPKASRASLTIREAIRRLRDHYGPPEPPPSADPFELVLWVNVAYLARPAKRREAFELLKSTLGTRPAAIMTARQEALERVTARGILKSAFADRLRECAAIAMEEFGGDLDAAIRGPLGPAKRALRRFPGIGEPGAERILLFAGRQPLLAPESNGLRALARLGFVREESSYSRTYAAARQVASGLPAKVSVLQEASLVLELHGRTLCKSSAPRCGECPLAGGCAHARRSGLQV